MLTHHHPQYPILRAFFGEAYCTCLASDIGEDLVKFVKPTSVSVAIRFNMCGCIAIDTVWKA